MLRSADDQVVEVLESIALNPDLRPILRDHDPIRQMVYQNKGRRARALFDRTNLPAAPWPGRL
ncbi:MAG: hypothetical protein U5N55_07370 [Cypionkella sp.]|nr:hypothetical protein [Cypionkella sp.]